MGSLVYQTPLLTPPPVQYFDYGEANSLISVLANLTLDSTQDSVISSNLKSRWGPYGAPAPECASTPATISPFAGGFELEAHFVAGDPVAALDLMRIEWGSFMLDDPRMTNSTFIEGYSADGSLHYAPYATDSRLVKSCTLLLSLD